MKKWQEMSTKVKVTTGVVTILVAGGLIVGGVKVSADRKYQSQLEGAKTELVTAEKNVDVDMKKTIVALYDAKSPSFLAEDISQEKIDELKAQLEKSQSSVIALGKEFNELDTKKVNSKFLEVQDRIRMTQDKLTVQNELNKEFSSTEEKKALSGSKVEKGLTIADDTTNDSLQKVVTISEKLPEDDFSKAVKELITVGQDQLKQIQTAEKSVTAFYDKDKVKADSKRTDYDKAVKEVNKIKRKSSKDALTKKLDAVKKVIEDREKKEKEEKAKKEANVQKESENKAQKQDNQEENTVPTNNDANTNNEDTWNGANGSNTDTGNNWNDNNNAGNTNTGGGNDWSNGDTNTGGASNTGNNGGSSNTGGNDNVGGNTGQTPPPPTEPSVPTIVAGAIGNSGTLVDSEAEAINIAEANIWNPSSQWGGFGYIPSPVTYSDGTVKWTINYY